MKDVSMNQEDILFPVVPSRWHQLPRYSPFGLPLPRMLQGILGAVNGLLPPIAHRVDRITKIVAGFDVVLIGVPHDAYGALTAESIAALLEADGLVVARCP
jgi:hypothetical protein